MSLQALTWVIYEVASDIKYSDFRVLLILADMADQQGRGAWPSRSTIGRLAGCSVRTVSYALKNLEASGLISRGDQRIVSNLGGYKPTVWNLNMGRSAKTAPLETAKQAVQHDCTPPVQTDCTPPVQRGVQKPADRCANSSATCLHKNPTKEEPYIEPRESNARARKQIPIPADWKPSEEHRALADRLGIDCDIEADKFRDRASTREHARPTGTRNTATGSSKARNADSPHQRIPTLADGSRGVVKRSNGCSAR